MSVELKLTDQELITLLNKRLEKFNQIDKARFLSSNMRNSIIQMLNEVGGLLRPSHWDNIEFKDLKDE